MSRNNNSKQGYKQGSKQGSKQGYKQGSNPESKSESKPESRYKDESYVRGLELKVHNMKYFIENNDISYSLLKDEYNKLSKSYTETGKEDIVALKGQNEQCQTSIYETNNELSNTKQKLYDSQLELNRYKYSFAKCNELLAQTEFDLGVVATRLTIYFITTVILSVTLLIKYWF